MGPMQYVCSESIEAIEAIRKLYPDSSRRTIQIWFKNGRFRLDGKALQALHQRIEKGQTLESIEKFQAPKVPGVKMIYEDRHFLVIDKPVGLLSVPLDEEKNNNKHALGLLKHSYNTDQIFAVHRIDRETSGLLLFARGKEAEERFDRLFEKHDIVREYYAIVEGRLKEKTGSWNHPLLELSTMNVVPSKEGKEAITHFSVIRQSAKYTYLKLQLETGRKHQIRVHCQMAGHPVVGDFRYGTTENPLKRLCLHACTLGFDHPFTKKKVHFESALPKVFAALGGY